MMMANLMQHACGMILPKLGTQLCMCIFVVLTIIIYYIHCSSTRIICSDIAWWINDKAKVLIAFKDTVIDKWNIK